MGSNGRKSKRRELDFYPTPAWMVDHLLDRLPFDYAGWGNRVLEPCVGAGNIVNAIRRRYPNAWIQTNDLDLRHPADTHYDATSLEEYWRPAGWLEPDWIITNPPFSDAFEIIRHAVDVARVGVAMLVRCTWVEPPKTGSKAAWLAAHPPKWRLTMERWSFDRAHQDSATTEWLVWSPFLEFKNEIIPGRGVQPAMFDPAVLATPGGGR